MANTSVVYSITVIQMAYKTCVACSVTVLQMAPNVCVAYSFAGLHMDPIMCIANSITVLLMAQNSTYNIIVLKIISNTCVD